MDETFGRYRLLRLIGAGAMGEVYEAHDSELDRKVAIKVLPPEFGADPVFRARFRREAKVAARLTEPHIITIHDVGEIDGRMYLTMPVVDGVDIQRLLRTQGPMRPERAVHVLEQLAAALDAAHTAGLVHRDVKPANALLTKNDFAYLIDFGIAQESSASRLTTTGMVIGTMAYMAPERFNGVADRRSDIYSLSCVLHECLTGAQPFPGRSFEEQITAHLTLAPPKPSRMNSAVPAGFDTVIATGMDKDPKRRFQSAQELAAAARKALSGTRADAPRMVDRPQSAAPDPSRHEPTRLRSAADLPPPPPPPPPIPAPRFAPAPVARNREPKLVVGGIAVAVVVLAIGVAGWFAINRTSRGEGSAPAVTLPAGSVACTPDGSPTGEFKKSAAGNDVTTCGFAEQARIAYDLSGASSDGKRAVRVFSPATKQFYDMSCEVTAAAGPVVTCSGGNDAVVYLY